MSLKTVEDWLECMNGTLDAQGVHRSAKIGWPPTEGPIKLATYDLRFIKSAAESIARKRGLTDKQILLAVKIITKYKRQWSQLGLDPSYLETDDVPLRLPQRQVDRTTSITQEGKTLRLRFPYNSDLISEMHGHKSGSYGGWAYDRDNKSWIIDMTEGNLRLLMEMQTFRDMHWEMDDDTKSLFDLAASCFFEPRAIPTMDIAYGELIFRDVPGQAMESFLSHRHGDINMDALIALRHGITLGPGIKSMHVEEHPINSLLDKFRWDSTHNRYLSTGELAAIMDLLRDAEFTFITHDQKSKLKLADVFMDTPNEKTYIDKAGSLADMDPGLYDPKKNILVLNMNSVMPVESMNLEDSYLGVLHINSDDDGQWPPVS